MCTHQGLLKSCQSWCSFSLKKDKFHTSEQVYLCAWCCPVAYTVSTRSKTSVTSSSSMKTIRDISGFFQRENRHMLPSTQLCLSYKLRSFFSNSYFTAETPRLQLFPQKDAEWCISPSHELWLSARGREWELCVEARACACVPQWVCLYAQPTRRVCVRGELCDAKLSNKLAIKTR